MNLPSDARYQSTPAPAQPRREEDFIGPFPSFRKSNWDNIWWTRGQLAYVAFIWAILIVVFLLMALFKPDYAQLLWRHPMGIKLSLGAIGSTLIGVVIYLALCLPINGLLPAHNPDRRSARNLALALVGAVLFMCFTVALFSLVIGPASIQIAESLKQGP